MGSHTPDRSIGYRAYEEVNRVFRRRKDFVAVTGITRQTVCNWGSGNAPSAYMLAVLCSHGLDVIYILTGKKSNTETKPVS